MRKKKNVSMYVSVCSLILAVVGFVFSIYAWHATNSLSNLAQRTTLLGLISQFRAININIEANATRMRDVALHEPIPTHLKINGHCVPVPKITARMTKDRKDIIATFDRILDTVSKHVAEADRLYSKFSNYNDYYSNMELSATTAAVQQKLEISKVLNKEPPALPPLPVDIPDTAGSAKPVGSTCSM